MGYSKCCPGRNEFFVNTKSKLLVIVKKNNNLLVRKRRKPLKIKVFWIIDVG